MSYGTVQAEKMTTESGYSLGAGNASSFKNRLINGNFYIWQRGTTVTSVGIDTFGPDRFKQWANSGTETGRGTWSQSTDVPSGQGFQYSCKLAVTTAQASFSSSEGYSFEQRIEANNVYDLAYGTAGAKSIVVSFWAKTNKTGTYTVAVSNNGTSSTNVYKQTVSLTSSWAKYEVTIPGDTSLAMTSTGTNQGMFVSIMLSNGVTSAATSSWVAYSLGNRTATGQVNFYDSTSNELFITGFQMEVGTVATSFDFRSYGTEFSLCQRYYYKIANTSDATSVPFGLGYTRANNAIRPFINFQVQMRVRPTSVETSGTASHYMVYYAGDANAVCTSVPSFDIASRETALLGAEVSGTPFPSGGVTYLRSNSTSAYLAFSAEL